MTPVLVMMLLATVQVLVIVRAQVAVTHAAREGARAAAVSADASAAARAAVGQLVELDGLSVITSTDAGRVSTVVRATVLTRVPLIGSLLPEVGVAASATMAVEP